MLRYRGVALLLFGFLAGRAAAQGNASPLSRWQHTALVGDAGPPRDGGGMMQRSTDGYLWLSAVGGLMRFDGVRFTVIDSASVPELTAGAEGTYYPLFVDDSGAMWIRGPNGLLVSYIDGRFTIRLHKGSGIHWADLDGEGRIWVYTDRLLLLHNGALEPPSLPAGVPDTGIVTVTRDTANGIWLGTNSDGVWHVTGSTAQHYGHGRIWPLAQTADGSVWANAEQLGPDLMRLHDGTWSPVPGPHGIAWIAVRSVHEGPDGSVWLATNSTGLMRWRNGVVERFSTTNGLSDDAVNGAFVDREGPVWVSTERGLDRLRPTLFVPIDSRSDSSGLMGRSFVLDISGAIWTAPRIAHSVYLLDGGAIRNQPGPITSKLRRLRATGPFALLAPSQSGGVWLAPVSGGLIHYSTRGEQTFSTRDGLPVERLLTGIEMRDGTVWATAFGGGLGRLRHGRYREIHLPEGSPNGRALVEDGHGRLWVGFRTTNKIDVLAGDSVVTRITLPGQDSVQTVSLALEGGDTLWAASTHSLYRIANRRAVEIRVSALANILARGVVLAITPGQLWMAGPSGIARIPLSDLHRAADGKSTAINPRVFGTLDGIADRRTSALTVFPIQVGRDGRVWVLTGTTLAVADPSTRFINSVPPRVHIEDVSIDGVTRKISEGGTIPPDAGRVAIRFAAPSLGLPERVRVEYRLDGADNSWIDGKTPHVAEYSQLQPGRYRFRVRAWNEDGVPSVGEATLGFRVLPAWYQAWWFFGLCILGVASMSGGLAVAAQSRRTHRVARDSQARFDAVLAERARVARELHDTLLQGFTGITLQLDGVRDSLRAQSEPLERELSQILQRADRTLREAREMVWDIRQPRPNVEDLGETLRALTKEFVATVDWRYAVDGQSRLLPAFVVTTILRIAKEAIVNALTHSHPTSILLHVTYETHKVLLEVCDDGRGVDSAMLETAALRGHWGVAGMRERAQAAGGTVLITSSPAEGTRVCVSLPAEPIA